MREKVRKHDDVYTVKDYVELVEESLFIDYDGYGNPSDGETKDVSICIRPSALGSDIPKGTTHVVWYNK